MMSRTATATVSNRLLETVGAVSGLEWSWSWPRTGLCGPTTAKWVWNVPRDIAGPWLRLGAPVTTADQGKRRWGGRLTEWQPTDSGVEIHAAGWKSILTGGSVDNPAWLALALVDEDDDPLTEDTWLPTDIPEVAFDSAIARGMTGLSRRGPLGSMGDVPLGMLDDAPVESLGALLERGAKREGKRCLVDEYGAVSYVNDPVSALWLANDVTNYIGTTDEQFFTRLYGLHTSSVDGVTGEPDQWRTVVTSDPDTEEKLAVVREALVDLRQLGLLSESDAETNVEGRFDLLGARMGFTAPFTLGRHTRRITGERADPGAVRAGHIAALPGVHDRLRSKTNRAILPQLISDSRHVVDDQATICVPMDYADRDLTSALEAAQKPDEDTAA